jgi:hypothetical protein
LAVSLALIAVLVATAGTTPRGTRGRVAGQRVAATQGAAPNRVAPGHAPTGTTTSTTAPASAPGPVGSGTSLLSAAALGGVRAPTPGGQGLATTTTVAPSASTTTTVAPSQITSQQPATRGTQNEGYLDPPLQTSQAFVFTGSGATQVSVVWSGSTYLTMVVSCPNGSQSVGGTSAMQATLPDAAGSCRATVSEPSSESTALTFTITIGPAGG